jgi:AcrR family transcriptional regulator
MTGPRGRTPAAGVEQALLDAAHRLLDTDGPAALTVRRIAAEAGVAPMGVYNRFGSKPGILEALYTSGFRMLAADLDRRAARGAAGIVAGMQRYRSFALAHPALYSLMFDRVVADFRPCKASQAVAFDALRRLVEDIHVATAAGEIADDGDPTEIAQRIWFACHGAITMELRGIGFYDDPPANYTRLVDTLLRGLAPPRGR